MVVAGVGAEEVAEETGGVEMGEAGRNRERVQQALVAGPHRGSRCMYLGISMAVNRSGRDMQVGAGPGPGAPWAGATHQKMHE